MDITERRWTGRSDAPAKWQGVEVVAAASHPLGFEAAAPIINVLANMGVGCAILSSVESAKTANNFRFSTPPAELNQTGVPEHRASHRVVIAAASGMPALELELDLLNQAVVSGDRIVLLEDGTPGGLHTLLAQMHRRGQNPQQSVDKILLANDSGRRLYPVGDFGISQERMMATGSSAFDPVKQLNPRQINEQVRRRLRIDPRALVIAYHGIRSNEFDGAELRATRAVSQTATQLAVLHPNRSVVLMHRRHPGDINPKAINKLLPASRGNLRVIPYEQSETEPTMNVAVAADINVALLSSLLTKSALIGALREFSVASAMLTAVLDMTRPQRPGRPTGAAPVYLLNPDSLRILGEYRYEMPIPLQLGAALAAYHDQDLIRAAHLAMDPMARYRLSRQQATLLRAEYAFDRPGTAADAALAELEALLT